MNEAVFGTIAATGFSVAFVHAMLPTHWLPFVLAGRGQGWSHTRTLTIAALAGGGHVLFTVALGALVAWLGITVDRWTGSIFPWIASTVLILFGLYYWFRAGHGHRHFGADAHGHDHGHDHPHDAERNRDHAHDHAHTHHEHEHPHVPAGHAHHPQPAQTALKAAGPRGDVAVILSLVAALTFSPCEGFLPVFVVGARYGWMGFAVLCLILAVATVTGMLLLTWMTLRGLQHLKLEVLDRYEGRILGGLLIALGLAVLVLES